MTSDHVGLMVDGIRGLVSSGAVSLHATHPGPAIAALALWLVAGSVSVLEGATPHGPHGP